MTGVFKRTQINTPCKVSFLLLDNFSLIAFSSMVEALRLANWLSGENLYEWQTISRDGKPVNCSANLSIACDVGMTAASRPTNLVVCGGIDVHYALDSSILGWLRRWAREGVYMGAICSGAYALAKAGLLNGYRATIHWSHIESFSEEFPELDISAKLFESDRDRFTCAGGLASVDMVLQDIIDNSGGGLAAGVADQIILEQKRLGNTDQRLPAESRLGINHPKLIEAILQMENNTEEPLPRHIIAGQAGLSRRQMERLFRQYMQTSPARHYLTLRLNKARSLLQQTSMSITEIAFACGFTSVSHFSKCYRDMFGTTPRCLRNKVTTDFYVKPNANTGKDAR